LLLRWQKVHREWNTKKKRKEWCGMKKVLLGLLILAVAAPAFAAVNVTTASAPGQVTITLEAGVGEDIVGIGLLVDATAGVVDSYTVDSFFDIFMDFAYDMETATPGSYTYGAGNDEGDGVGVNMTKGANPGDHGITVTLPSDAPFSISVGGLGGPALPLNPAPQVANIVLKAAAGAVVDLDIDTLRGGIVGTVGGVSGAHAVTGLPLTGVVISPLSVPETITGTPVVAKTTAAPAIAGRVNGGRTETFVASGVAGSQGGTLEYQFTWGDSTVSAWGAATQTKVYTYTAAATYNVTVQARLAADPATLSAVSAPIALTTEEVKSSAPFYAAWAQYGRPTCWAYPRNCKGDVDGLKQGNPGAGYAWVSTNDLTPFLAAWKVLESPKGPGIMSIPNGICADFNRDQQGNPGAGYARVSTNDLTPFLASWKVLEPTKGPGIGICAQTNYHYWTGAL
jgi:hypothetical protein